MKFVSTMSAALLGAAACSPGGSPALATFADSSSYAVGQAMGTNLKMQGVDIDLPVLIAGLQDAYGAEGQLSQAQLEELIHRLSDPSMRSESAMNPSTQQTIADGDAYRASFAAQEGVIETDSGVLYEVLAEGDGPKPGPTDRVTVHYVGALIDGTIFDSSRERNEPATFGLNQVIPGWTQALQLMSVGSTYRIVIPPQWAYGSSGRPPRIPPESTLVFEVELLGIE